MLSDADDAPDLRKLVSVARGDRPADLLFRGGRLVDVLSGEIRRADLAVVDGRVVGVDEEYEAREVVDCRGKWLAPGFIDGHMHLESTLVTLPEFARVALPRGNVGAVLDPHEIANVHGIRGIRYVLESRRGLPFRAFVMASSCVPASPFETSGAELDADDLAPLFDEEGVPGLAEMMNYPGVVSADPGVLRKLEAARARGAVVDGHAPGVTGRQLDAYAAAGPGSDHESTTLEEAREKLRKGLRVMIREASTARNLTDLLPLVTERNARRFSLVTDDRHPHDLLDEGAVDHAVRKAIGAGLDPVTAYRMATVNTAEWFGLHRSGHGALAPGWKADVLVLDDLEEVRVDRVYVAGQPVASEGEVTVDLPDAPSDLPVSVHVDPGDFPGFRIPAEGERVRVIEIVPGQILTRASVEEPRVRDGAAVADPDRDLAKLAVVARHGRDGVGLGFVRGLGLREGALGSSVAHDSHNLVLAGTDDADLRRALEELVRMQGGFVAVRGGEVEASLPLPIAGLMTDRPVEEVRAGLDDLHAAYQRLGGSLESPFMALSFLTLAVIPSLKLTDRGLVDVDAFELVDLWAEEG